MRAYRVLLLGDETRLAYQQRVRELLAAEEGIVIETVWPGESTGDSEELAAGIDAWIDEFKPDAVHFNSGLVDGRWHREEKHNHVPVGEYELYLKRVVDVCKLRLGGDIVFATTTPVNDEKQSDQPGRPYDRFNREIEEYNVAAQQIMLADNVLINHLDQVVRERDDEYLAEDGLSLSPTGVEAAAQATATCIRSLWH